MTENTPSTSMLVPLNKIIFDKDNSMTKYPPIFLFFNHVIQQGRSRMCLCSLLKDKRDQPENWFGGRALWNLFLKFLKFDILKFQKILGKILEVQNDVFYSPANFQNEIVCIPAYTKKINSEKS
jgi:hypothetical protein